MERLQFQLVFFTSEFAMFQQSQWSEDVEDVHNCSLSSQFRQHVFPDVFVHVVCVYMYRLVQILITSVYFCMFVFFPFPAKDWPTSLSAPRPDSGHTLPGAGLQW